MSEQKSTDESTRQQQLRQLAHDVRTPLGIISTGLEALKAVRDSPEDFNKLYQEIQRDGVSELKQKIEYLLQVAGERD